MHFVFHQEWDVIQSRVRHHARIEDQGSGILGEVARQCRTVKDRTSMRSSRSVGDGS